MKNSTGKNITQREFVAAGTSSGVLAYVLNTKGGVTGVTMYNANETATSAVCTDKGPENVELEPLLSGVAGD